MLPIPNARVKGPLHGFCITHTLRAIRMVSRMAREPRQAKSESLTIRLDPKTRFILEFISRVRGQTITTVVERAIIEAANNVSIDDGRVKWQDLWSVSEGARNIKAAGHAELYPSFEDEQLLEFVFAHKEFFYYNGDTSKNLQLASIDIIWPNIQAYMDEWYDCKLKNYWAAGHKMAAAIKAAEIKAPVWPPANPPAQSSPLQRSGGGSRMSEIIDDDIPF